LNDFVVQLWMFKPFIAFTTVLRQAEASSSRSAGSSAILRPPWMPWLCHAPAEPTLQGRRAAWRAHWTLAFARRKSRGGDLHHFAADRDWIIHRFPCDEGESGVASWAKKVAAFFKASRSISIRRNCSRRRRFSASVEPS
jgi:hypothetical protein